MSRGSVDRSEIVTILVGSGSIFLLGVAVLIGAERFPPVVYENSTIITIGVGERGFDMDYVKATAPMIHENECKLLEINDGEDSKFWGILCGR